MGELRVETADKYIKVLYFQRNTTALIQPMDQNVIKTLGAHYEKRLLMDRFTSSDVDDVKL